jgi:hypothetical protein
MNKYTIDDVIKSLENSVNYCDPGDERNTLEKQLINLRETRDIKALANNISDFPWIYLPNFGELDSEGIDTIEVEGTKLDL